MMNRETQRVGGRLVLFKVRVRRFCLPPIRSTGLDSFGNEGGRLRRFLSHLVLFVVFVGLVEGAIGAESRNTPVPSRGLMDQLIDGFTRFENGESLNNGPDSVKSGNLQAVINPEIVVVACADLPIPVEILFDQPRAKIHVISNAGNVVSEATQSKIGYTLSTYRCDFVIVLGHEQCATLKSVKMREDSHERASPHAAKHLADIRDGSTRIVPESQFDSLRVTLSEQNVREGLKRLKERFNQDTKGHFSRLVLAGVVVDLKKQCNMIKIFK
jgi:carbonic anhydrase